MISAETDKAFLGTGWAFPPRPDAGGEAVGAGAEEDVRQAVRLILETNRGERVMRPDFGAGLRALAFEPLSTATIALARYRVEDALVKWEPRIDQVSVTATADPPRGLLVLDVRYRIRATNTFYNLVYPFYLTEGRDE